MAERIIGGFSAEQVECIAFLRALQITMKYRITHFELEGDALSIVQKINNNEPDLPLIGNLIHGIRIMLNEFDIVKESIMLKELTMFKHIFCQNWHCPLREVAFGLLTSQFNAVFPTMSLV